MRELDLALRDNFFVDHAFFQAIGVTADGLCRLRRQDGHEINLGPGDRQEIVPGCWAGLCEGAAPGAAFRLGFDAPPSVLIDRGALRIRDVPERLVHPNPNEETIDHLIEEEFAVNEAFAAAFFARGFSGLITDVRDRRAYRSVMQMGAGSGESDLILTATVDGVTHALMIENKITAAKQPDQPERYLERGKDGVLGQLWNDFDTCLLAPEAYLRHARGRNYYHNYIAYEDVMAMLEATIADAPRLAFRVEKFKKAIDKKEKYAALPVRSEASAFVEKMHALAAVKCPGLRMFTTGPANASIIWFHFVSDAYPEGVRVIIQADAVVIQIDKAHHRLSGEEAFFHDGRYKFGAASASDSIRRHMSRIDCLRPFEAQADVIEAALAQVNLFDDLIRAEFLA